ncbi:SDR family NAD(P)-dependent oxidoreductase [Paenibacillus solisilvae]|uniref:SDR family NAD(P)-dependent oxidoreductase n=1 Tax=Paenibacillus solisilvae TaxID=2486751 RepID=A0ABW0W4G2_9BACL
MSHTRPFTSTPFLSIHEALKHFPAGGSIIIISSIASENPVQGSVLYASTKAAVNTLTLALAKEQGNRNIRASNVLH